MRWLAVIFTVVLGCLSGFVISYNGSVEDFPGDPTTEYEDGKWKLRFDSPSSVKVENLTNDLRVNISDPPPAYQLIFDRKLGAVNRRVVYRLEWDESASPGIKGRVSVRNGKFPGPMYSGYFEAFGDPAESHHRELFAAFNDDPNANVRLVVNAAPGSFEVKNIKYAVWDGVSELDPSTLGPLRDGWRFESNDKNSHVRIADVGKVKCLGFKPGSENTKEPWTTTLWRDIGGARAGEEIRIRITARADSPRDVFAQLSRADYSLISRSALWTVGNDWKSFEFSTVIEKDEPAMIFAVILGGSDKEVFIREIRSEIVN